MVQVDGSLKVDALKTTENNHDGYPYDPSR